MASPTRNTPPMLDASRSAARWLVVGVLRAVERSAAYAAPETWTRPVIVRWATAWTLDPLPEDAARARERLQAAAWLAREGAGTVTYEKPPYDDRPRTIRCDRAQFAALEGLARTMGIPLLTDILVALREAWRVMAHVAPAEALPAWWLAYETRLAEALATPAPSGIGIAVERLIDEWSTWLDGVRAARGIAAGASGYERVVSERLLGHSKRLATLRRSVAAHLQVADPQWGGRGSEAPGVVLDAYGVRRIAPMLDIAGPVVIEADGSRLDCGRIEGLARCPGTWAAAVTNGARNAGIAVVTTIENETSAWSYVEERGGPEGLRARRELVIYTSGFSTEVGVRTLAGLAVAIPEASFRHWGDADEHGLRIWQDLTRRANAPLTWWRTDAAWVMAAHARGAGTPLSAAERQSLAHWRETLAADAAATRDGVALGCADALLRLGVKIEQEAFEPALDAGDTTA